MLATIQQELARTYHKAITQLPRYEVGQKSNFVDDEWAKLFGLQLNLFHAQHLPGRKFKKEVFEDVFCYVMEKFGYKCTRPDSKTHPGADVTIDRFRGKNNFQLSLKTEASNKIDPHQIYISKYREARVIRDCTNAKKMYDWIVDSFIDFLAGHDTVFMLRCLPDKRCLYRYDLLEVPGELLVRILSCFDDNIIEHRNKNLSYSIPIYEKGEEVMEWYFCGGVEKISIRKLKVDACILHCSWFV